MIGGVREMLRFQAKTGMFMVNLAGFALQGPVHGVPGKELYPRLCGIDFHLPPALRIEDLGGQGQLIAFLIQDVVVIIPVLQLVETGIESALRLSGQGRCL